MGMLRGIWVTTRDGNVSVSRRFLLTERKHRRQILSSEFKHELPKGVGDAPPLDVELGSRIVDSYSKAQNTSSCSSIYKHLVEVAPALWPLVVIQESNYIVSVLPLVPAETFLEYERLKQEQKASSGDELAQTQMTSVVKPVMSSIGVALDIAVNIAKLIARGRDMGQDQLEKKIWNYILDAIPVGTPLDTNARNIENICSLPYGHKPLKEPQPFWKPHLYKGRARMRFQIREDISGFISSTPSTQQASVGSSALAQCKLVGQIFCCADIESLPDITVPLLLPSQEAKEKEEEENRLEFILHQCARPSGSIHDQPLALCFTPPLNWFTLASYAPRCLREATWDLPISCQLKITVIDPSTAQFEAVIFRNAKCVSNKQIEFCTLQIKLHPDMKVSEAPTRITTGTFQKNAMVWNVFPPKGSSRTTEHYITVKAHQLPVAAPLADDDVPDGLRMGCCSLRDKLEATACAHLAWKIPGRTLTGIGIDKDHVSMHPSVQKSAAMDCSVETNARITVIPHIVM